MISNSIKKTALRIIVYLGLGYLCVVVGMYLAQDSIVFHPNAVPAEVYQQHVNHHTQALSFTTPEGIELKGLLYQTRADERRPLMIVFSGNAQDSGQLLDVVRQALPRLDIATFYYRGFGPTAGQPSERALFKDALFIHDELITRLKPTEVYLLGASLGTGISTYLSSRRHIKGMVLISPFDSILAIAQNTYPFLPHQILLQHPFRSDLYMTNNDTPVSIILSEVDHTVEHGRTQNLVKHIKNYEFSYTVKGSNHGSIYRKPELINVVRTGFKHLCCSKATKQAFYKANVMPWLFRDRYKKGSIGSFGLPEKRRPAA